MMAGRGGRGSKLERERVEILTMIEILTKDMNGLVMCFYDETLLTSLMKYKLRNRGSFNGLTGGYDTMDQCPCMQTIRNIQEIYDSNLCNATQLLY